MNVPPSCKFDDMIENGAEQTCFTGQKEGALFEKTQWTISTDMRSSCQQLPAVPKLNRKFRGTSKKFQQFQSKSDEAEMLSSETIKILECRKIWIQIKLPVLNMIKLAVWSEISDLCEISDLILFVSYFFLSEYRNKVWRLVLWWVLCQLSLFV